MLLLLIQPCIAAAADDGVLLYEDFSGFTAGSVDSADATNIGNSEDDLFEDVYLDDYTATAGWYGYGVYQAGGTVVVRGVENYGSVLCELTSPYMTLSGSVKATVRARIYPESDETSFQGLMMMRKKTYGQEISYITITDQWKEYTFTGTFSGEYAFSVRMGDGTDASVPPLQIDWIKIEENTVTEAPETPVAREATEIEADSFTANWNRVANATKYKLYVTYEENGQTHTFLDGKEYDASAFYFSPSAKVTGIDPDVFYSYYVTALNGEMESDKSNVIDITYMPVIQSSKPTNVTQDAFTANWEESPKADRYTLNLYRITESGREKIDSKTVEKGNKSYTFENLDNEASIYYAYDVTITATYHDNTYNSMASLRWTACLGGIDYPRHTVLYEDFSKFANGSETDIYYREITNPNDPNASEYVNEFQTRVIPDEYTSVPGWKGFGVAEAGGVAAVSYVPYENYYQGGYLRLPATDLKGEMVSLTFRIRPIPQYFEASAENPAVVPIYVYDETGYADADIDVITTSESLTRTASLFYSDYSGSDNPYLVWMDVICEMTDDDWTEIEYTFINHTQGPILIQIGNYGGITDSAPYFIDDITVSTAIKNIDTPTGLRASDFTRDGFTANWERTPKATGYELSYYKIIAGTPSLIETVEVGEELSFTVTGLDITETDSYCYELKAIRDTPADTYISAASEKVYVTIKDESGVNDLKTGKVDVYAQGQDICVSAETPQTVEVFNTTGMLVTRFMVDAGLSRHTVSSKGVFIVRIGDTVSKVTIR